MTALAFPKLLGTGRTFRFRWAVLVTTAIAFGFCVWGIRADLPYTPKADEDNFVERGLRIAATGDLNPQWFGHPGSTVIYPLAAIYHVFYAITGGGNLFRPNPQLQAVFAADPIPFYMLGRLLSVIYAAFSVFVVYKIGKRAGGSRVGIVAAWFLAIAPLVVKQSQITRTDTIGLLAVLLGLWMCLRLYEQSTTLNVIMTGVAIGFALSSRYFMVMLVPVAAVALALAWQRVTPAWYRTRAVWVHLMMLMAVIGITFAITTPFFFLDFLTALRSIRQEARSSHTGADGFSFFGNAEWYLFTILPNAVSLPVIVLAVAGAVRALVQRHVKQIGLLGFACFFLCAISASRLHWERWALPIVPILALFAASALVTGLEFAAQRFHWRWLRRAPAIGVATVLVSLAAIFSLVQYDIRQMHYSTCVLAREWVLEHIPPNSQIAQEWHTAPLNIRNFGKFGNDRITTPQDPTPYTLLERERLAEQRTLDDYKREGYQYLLVSQQQYKAYFADPDRFPAEITFYNRLFTEGTLLQKFTADATHGGPTVSIYYLPEATPR